MTTTAQPLLTFEQFLQVVPEEGTYELVNGEIVEVEPTRAHKNVARYLMYALNDEKRRLGLNVIVDKDIVIRTVTADGKEQGRNPDVSVVSQALWNSNVLSYGALTEPIQLAVEVVSTNWEDDYVDKLDEYQRLGIPEYWIVDYLAIASRAYLGSPKVPTVSVYRYVNGEYQLQKFTNGEQIISPFFRELKITVDELANASGIQRL
jgi:Uma2 family endonuclease